MSFDRQLASRMSSPGVQPLRVGDSKFGPSPPKPAARSLDTDTLDGALNDPHSRRALDDFARSRYAGESLDCLSAIDFWMRGDFVSLEALLVILNPNPSRRLTFPLLERVPPGLGESARLQINLARSIVETFFVPHAPHWVCLSHVAYVALHQKVASDTGALDPAVFQASRREVMASVATGIWPLFQAAAETNTLPAAPRTSVATRGGNDEMRLSRAELSDRGRSLLFASMGEMEQADAALSDPPPRAPPLPVAAARDEPAAAEAANGPRVSSLFRRVFTGKQDTAAENGTFGPALDPTSAAPTRVRSVDKHPSTLGNARPKSIVRRIFTGKSTTSSEASWASRDAAAEPAAATYSDGAFGSYSTHDGGFVEKDAVSASDIFASSPRANAASLPRQRKPRAQI